MKPNQYNSCGGSALTTAETSTIQMNSIIQSLLNRLALGSPKFVSARGALLFGVSLLSSSFAGASYLNHPRITEILAYFDGANLVGFDNPGNWKIADGAITMPGDVRTGRLASIGQYDDVQFHLQWKPPFPPLSSNSGNSGVFFGPYELQILDSYNQRVRSPDAHAGSIYGQYAPYVNASLPPNRWTSFNVLFHNAEFSTDGSILRPARMTVVQNGIFIHHDTVLVGELRRRENGNQTILYNQYIPHGKNAVSLQEHGSVVSFRDIWLLTAAPDESDSGMTEIDLMRLDEAQRDPSLEPRSKLKADPPVVRPAGHNGKRPSDSVEIGVSELEGARHDNDDVIIIIGETNLTGNHVNSQLYFEWTGAGEIPLRILGEEIALRGLEAEKNVTTIAFSLGSAAGRTWVTITSLTNGFFQQKRTIKDISGPFRTSIGKGGGRWELSNVWIRDLEPAVVR